jgi:hypothetical protein
LLRLARGVEKFEELMITNFRTMRRTHHTVDLLLNGGSFSKSSAPPLFLEDEIIFQKSATMVPWGIQFPMEPSWPNFEKCSHHREKGGADFFSGFVWWVVWAESPIQI